MAVVSEDVPVIHGTALIYLEKERNQLLCSEIMTHNIQVCCVQVVHLSQGKPKHL